MEHNNETPVYLTVNERLAVLEVKFDQLSADHATMCSKLDQLLELKSKGMGAVWLIGLIIGGGFMTAMGFLGQIFNKGHL